MLLNWLNPLTGTRRMWSTTACLALSLVVALLGVSNPVGASQIPAGCSNNGVSIDIQKSATAITNGDTVTYTVTAANGPDPSCNTINNVIKGFCPGADGQPNIAPAVTFPTIATMAVPTATFTVGSFDCVVNVNAGVISPIASATLSGSLQDNPQQDDPFGIQKTVSVIVEQAPPPQPPPPPPINTVPTLSEWVMVLLAVFVALVGVATLRKKRTA
jgi:hypothetical protein